MKREYEKTLNEIRDHRLPKDTPHDLHVSLQVQAFGEFIDVVSKPEVEPKYLEVAGRVMMKMGKHYCNESDRQRDFLQDVATLFPHATGIREGGAITDYTNVVLINGSEYRIGNWEFKNELSGITSEPN